MVALQVTLFLFYAECLVEGALNRWFDFPFGTTILNALVALAACSFVALEGSWRAIGFRHPSSWRSLLWFAPLLLPILYPLTGHVYVGVGQTLPFVLLYAVQSLQVQMIFNGVLLEKLRVYGVWSSALLVAVLQGVLVAGLFVLIPPEDGFVLVLLFQFASTAASAFVAAALRLRTGLLWPLLVADVLSGITYYVTLPPNPSPYPLTAHRVLFVVASILYGLIVGCLALATTRRAEAPESGEQGSDAVAAAVAASSEGMGASVVAPAFPTRPVIVATRQHALGCLGMAVSSVALGVTMIGAMVSGGQLLPLAPQYQQASRHPYFAAVPGSSCDHGGGYWVQDPQEAYACSPDGLLITQRYFGYQAEAYFSFVGDGYDSDQFIPHSYRVEVAARIVSGQSETCVGLHVHIQDFQGRQSFFACSDGTWDISRCDLHCEKDSDLLSGALPAAPSTTAHFFLTVEVTDRVLAFFVNGAQVATLQDATYTSTDQLALAVYGPKDSGNPPSAIFSNFQYFPLA
jgi:hypothetical protein